MQAWLNLSRTLEPRLPHPGGWLDRGGGGGGSTTVTRCERQHAMDCTKEAGKCHDPQDPMTRWCLLVVLAEHDCTQFNVSLSPILWPSMIITALQATLMLPPPNDARSGVILCRNNGPFRGRPVHFKDKALWHSFTTASTILCTLQQILVPGVSGKHSQASPLPRLTRQSAHCEKNQAVLRPMKRVEIALWGRFRTARAQHQLLRCLPR